MNSMLIQRLMCLPARLDQPPAKRCCACCCRRHRDRARDTARTSFIDADDLTGSWLGGTLTTSIEQHARLARLESP